jgi:hypothetical protein
MHSQRGQTCLWPLCAACEEIGPREGPSSDALGNFPQAFTHMGLISAAFNLNPRRDPEGGMSGQPSYLGVAIAGWVAALKSSDSLERRLAAHALAEIGRTAQEAVPALIEALRDSESFVRVWAAAALARVEPEHPDVIPALVAGTRDGISFVRSLAAWHLGRLGPRHPGIEVALPDLHELLNDNDPSVSAREPRGQGRAARGTEVSLGPPMTRLFRTRTHGGHCRTCRSRRSRMGPPTRTSGVLANSIERASFRTLRSRSPVCCSMACRALSSGPTTAINSGRSSISSSARTARRGEQAEKKAEQRDHRR